MSNAVAPQLVMFAAIFAIFYFVLIRPQQQQKRKQEASLLAIKRGDEIVTAGGIIGDVVHIKALGPEGSPTLEDRITIRSGESRLVVERGRIGRVIGATTPTTGATKAATSGSPS
jgi:preprotein translocase subunit YajC